MSTLTNMVTCPWIGKARAVAIVMPQGQRAAPGRRCLGCRLSGARPAARRREENPAPGKVRCGGVWEEELYNTNTTGLISSELRSGHVQDGTGVCLASRLLLSQHDTVVRR